MNRLDPRLRRLSLAAVSAVATLVSFPASAQTADFGPRPPSALVSIDTVSTSPRVTSSAPAIAAGSGIHAGANNPRDQALARDVAAALADEPRLDGATVTVSANNGRVSLSGSAESPEQGAIAEQVARDVAGPAAVSGTLSPQGG